MATKKRETGDDVSAIASKVLRVLRATRLPKDWVVVTDLKRHSVSVGDLRSVAASCLAQDETKGKRPAKRKAKKR
jgi:hypothetical protein